MAGRADQPRCKTLHCNHAVSFHSGGKTRCKATGCLCKKYRGELPEVKVKRRQPKKVVPPPRKRTVAS